MASPDQRNSICNGCSDQELLIIRNLSLHRFRKLLYCTWKNNGILFSVWFQSLKFYFGIWYSIVTVVVSSEWVIQLPALRASFCLYDVRKLISTYFLKDVLIKLSYNFNGHIFSFSKRSPFTKIQKGIFLLSIRSNILPNYCHLQIAVVIKHA